ncbi:hypothetical protein MGU_03540 [Metarhizium guizhouense ARSEF 977]|uniref:ZN622/Rei1/Reh1 zinc finger C2H2-type domain-containing protein n=1 Tax=Metarhizium guizhouense (strain ARSEF 977) TaxID=1276136 RepID=A0A0B4H2V8_METGA|nr:hypothetical protein MGU_03540 [Metarhizium guizhouense ARSEF 977]
MADTNTGVVVDQLPLTVAQAPSLCRLCNVQLLGLQTWRAHVKSDGHVYKLRIKVTQPGGATPPPPPSPRSTKPGEKRAAPPHTRKIYEPKVGIGQDQNADSDSDTEDEPSVPEFDPGQCLFCAQESAALGDNMAHMAAAHGFSVPFRDRLAVGLETVVRHLHFVIYHHRECICCGARRSTASGAQHHMLAKGHCRFDVSPDTGALYEMPQRRNAVAERVHRDAGVPVRLPSGKLICRRGSLDAHEPRAASRTSSTPGRALDPVASRSETCPNTTTSLAVARRRGGSGSGQVVRSSEALLAAQLSRLRVAGDRAQRRVEERKRGRLERANNTILFKHYRRDAGDGRIGRQF